MKGRKKKKGRKDIRKERREKKRRKEEKKIKNPDSLKKKKNKRTRANIKSAFFFFPVICILCVSVSIHETKYWICSGQTINDSHFHKLLMTL